MNQKANPQITSYSQVYRQLDWLEVRALIYEAKPAQVERALTKRGKRDLRDLAALLSPAAAPYLETMAQLSHQLTKKRFGKTIQLYIPLYLSNECSNSCLYCGFRRENQIERLVLDEAKIMKEVEVIKSMGFDHVLLVTGESKGKVGMDYFRQVFQLLRPHFANISMEVQPLKEEEYKELISLGLHGVMVYQETYGEHYGEFHPKGKKSDFLFRLETPDRLGRAGIHKMGLGVLLGLDDWRVDSWYVGSHLDYLERNYWKSKFSISFPRLRPATGIMEPRVVMSDRELVQAICAYRLFSENVELSLSTRENRRFRDHVLKLGITSMSAGSKTDPGGYASGGGELKQFEIDDDRSPQAVAQMLDHAGYEAIWKDWDPHYGMGD